MSPAKIIEKFRKINCLVIGDVMLDTYIAGSVNRISPEAPVPIVNVEKKESRPGGAANVAMNIRALGGSAVICSVTGNDDAGKKLKALLTANGISPDEIVTSRQRITTEKTRILCRHQQMLRYDEEMVADLSPSDEKKLIQKISRCIASGKFDVVILQDYNKGALTARVIRDAIRLSRARRIPVAVDPKRKNFFEYRNVTLFKPNLREVNEALQMEAGTEKQSLERAAALLKERLRHQITFITLSEAGSFITDHRASECIPASKRGITDVSGAGDTVLSVAALCIAAGMNFRDTGHIANLAGGIACSFAGVVPVSKEQLLAEADRYLQK